MNNDSIRHSAVAGSFYLSDSRILLKEVSSYLNLAEPSIFPDRVIGIISPHAGYDYSGKTAAFGYKLIKGKKIQLLHLTNSTDVTRQISDYVVGYLSAVFYE